MTFTTPVRAFYWHLRIVLFSLRWIPRFNLGDRVIYQGQEWTLIQGVCAPTWELFKEGCDATLQVHERDMTKVRSLSNYARSFFRGYGFYMQSWYAIWMREGIKPWMRDLPIFGKTRRRG